MKTKADHHEPPSYKKKCIAVPLKVFIKAVLEPAYSQRLCAHGPLCAQKIDGGHAYECCIAYED